MPVDWVVVGLDNGGTSNNGTVFEIASGTSTAVTVASFNGANGSDPVSGVIFDSSSSRS